MRVDFAVIDAIEGSSGSVKRERGIQRREEVVERVQAASRVRRREFPESRSAGPDPLARGRSQQDGLRERVRFSVRLDDRGSSMMNWRSAGGFAGRVGDVFSCCCFSRWESAHKERSEETRVSHEAGS